MKVKLIQSGSMKPWKSHPWLHANKDKWESLKEGEPVEVPKEIVEFLAGIVEKAGPESHSVKKKTGTVIHMVEPEIDV